MCNKISIRAMKTWTNENVKSKFKIFDQFGWELKTYLEGYYRRSQYNNLYYN